MAARKRGLGRGLDALLGDSGLDANAQAASDELNMLAVADIHPGAYQPRRHWNEAALDELAQSIKAQGLVQPVVVRRRAEGGYELIAGERRWRAACKAGLEAIPALVKEVPDAAVPAMALVENIQRQDLTPLEEAEALRRLLEDFGLTHQQVADAVGRSRTTVTNLLRLNDLPPAIRELLDAGQLDMGHARCLLTLPAAIAIPLARRASLLGWSVRELERAAREAQAAPGQPAAAPRDPDLLALERELSERLAARVELAPKRGGRGRLIIHYHSLDELDGILEHLRH